MCWAQMQLSWHWWWFFRKRSGKPCICLRWRGKVRCCKERMLLIVDETADFTFQVKLAICMQCVADGKMVKQNFWIMWKFGLEQLWVWHYAVRDLCLISMVRQADWYIKKILGRHKCIRRALKILLPTPRWWGQETDWHEFPNCTICWECQSG